MTTTRKPFRTQWIHRDEPKPEPVDARLQRAHRLPRPGPGILITVPLSLLPEYLALYHLAPMTRGEVRDAELRAKKTKPSGVLYVKRVRGGGDVH